ncbi:MAG: pantetheine-phosphate adenylyltransferase [Spirochaeta sp. LUC14_002_19_P3]|nr:MAG: pantetheine-phosphate adenylyltransferase [Spirochaeta sp. LUC14_002_19_P3]
MVKAVYAGTFDPPTLGHLDVIRRGTELFDSLDVVIAVNQEKSPMLSLDVRKNLLSGEMERLKLGRATVSSWDGLIVDYCRHVGATVLLRGVRSAQDYAAEFEMASLNKQLYANADTVILLADIKYFLVSSSVVKEIIKLDGDVSRMVSPAVEAALKHVAALDKVDL